MPLPMKSAANRLGKPAPAAAAAVAAPFAAGVSAPQIRTDSSHGKVIVTPTPLRNVRRESFSFRICLDIGNSVFRETAFDACVQKLRARHNRFDKASESVLIGHKFRAQVVNQRFVAQNQRAAQTVRQHLAAKIIQEIVFTMLVDELLQPIQTVAGESTWKFGPCVNGPSAQIDRATLADRPVAFEHQPKRVEPRVTS